MLGKQHNSPGACNGRGVLQCACRSAASIDPGVGNNMPSQLAKQNSPGWLLHAPAWCVSSAGSCCTFGPLARCQWQWGKTAPAGEHEQCRTATNESSFSSKPTQLRTVTDSPGSTCHNAQAVCLQDYQCQRQANHAELQVLIDASYP